jgi:pimeloyl-ACP methyl ester carboxylesterase
MTIAYDRTGDGPPLVLLHPLGADRRVWDPIVGPLAAAHEVIALDLPGFG